ncbi:FAD synthase [uncultured archaeon]|nr:FAD synthase [uncultured archaeon]
MTKHNKVLFLNDLISKVGSLRKEGKIVVQSHGIFDLIHPGIIKHLNEAKEQGDILIVTVIKDKDVRRGPGRPIFPENFRVENVSSLEQVDYVCLVDDEIPFSCVKSIKPDVFAKGQAYKERDIKIHDKIFEEEKEFYFGKSKIYETGGFSFSSSQIINNFLDIYPNETKNFLKKFSDKYGFDEIVEKLNSLKKLKVIIIGDGIIDEYHYCEPMGKSAKSPIIVNKYLNHEVFAGGAFIIANHIAGLCDKVQLVSLLGKEESREDFIVNNLKPNIGTKFFYRDDGPTVCKKRYINLNQKVFEINYLNNVYINGSCELDVINYLKSTISEYDLVLISDFGHGFITNNIINAIKDFSKIFAVNTQTNAANAGFNMITKYNNPNFVCLDEIEVRLGTQDRFGDIEDIAKKLSNMLNADGLIVTLGKKGSIGVNSANEINRTPVFSTKVIDTVGAGDAFFAFAAPCFAHGMPLNLVSFIGNAAGALAVQIVGNKKPVEKYELLEFINAMLKHSP